MSHLSLDSHYILNFSCSKVSGDADVHITKEDQQRINTFANKNAKMNEIKADIEKKKVTASFIYLHFTEKYHNLGLFLDVATIY